MYRLFHDAKALYGRNYIVVDPMNRYCNWYQSPEEAIQEYEKTKGMNPEFLYRLKEGYQIKYPCIAKGDSIDEVRTSLLLQGDGNV